MRSLTKPSLTGLAATPPWGPGKAVAVKCTQYFLELGNLKVPGSLKAVVRKTVTGTGSGPGNYRVLVIIYGPIRGNAFYDCSAFKTLNLARRIYPEFGFLSSISCDIKPLNKSSSL